MKTIELVNSFTMKSLLSFLEKQTKPKQSKVEESVKWYSVIIAEKVKEEKSLNQFTQKVEFKKKKISKIIYNRHKISDRMIYILKAGLGSLFAYELYHNGVLKKSFGNDIQIRIHRRKLDKSKGYELKIEATKKIWLDVIQVLNFVKNAPHQAI